MAGSVSATVDQYRVLAGLASDWLWELDEKLHFVFHDGVNPSLSGYSNKDLVGKCRISLMNSTFPESAALKEHNHCLITQKRMDLVLPTGLDTVKHVHIIAEPQFTESGVFTGFFGCARDVSTRVEMEEQLNKLATLDDLTGAMNRREFEKQLNCLHGEAQQGANHFALCVLDLDRFKLYYEPVCTAW